MKYKTICNKTLKINRKIAKWQWKRKLPSWLCSATKLQADTSDVWKSFRMKRQPWREPKPILFRAAWSILNRISTSTPPYRVFVFLENTTRNPWEPLKWNLVKFYIEVRWYVRTGPGLFFCNSRAINEHLLNLLLWKLCFHFLGKVRLGKSVYVCENTVRV